MYATHTMSDGLFYHAAIYSLGPAQVHTTIICCKIVDQAQLSQGGRVQDPQ